MVCATTLESLPLVYSSLEEHQMSDQFCGDIKQKIATNSAGIENFHVRKNLVCFTLRVLSAVDGLSRPF